MVRRGDGTYVNGPLGFVVQDAFSFDTGPSSNRELRGIWLTSFTPACDKTKAVAMAVRNQFGRVDAGAARGLALRHDHGSNFMSDVFQKQIRSVSLR